MKCLLSRITIDQREESGKPLPKIVSKHILDCPGCKSYLNLGKEMCSIEPDMKIPEDLIQNLNKRILSNIKSSGNRRGLRLFQSNFFRIPVASAILILIIIAGMSLLNINRDAVGPLETKPIFSLNRMKGSINELLTKVESPIVKEAEGLKRSVNSAKNYLRSVLDFGLPGIPD